MILFFSFIILLFILFLLVDVDHTWDLRDQEWSILLKLINNS